MKYIAVCDDDVDMLSTLKKVLKKSGFEVFTTQTEQDLYKLLENQKIDLVLIDYNLEPDDFEDHTKNGLEIISEIREKFDDKCMKLVLTTSPNYAQLEDVKKAGGNEILFKPLFPLTKITDLLTKLSNESCD